MLLAEKEINVKQKQSHSSLRNKQLEIRKVDMVSSRPKKCQKVNLVLLSME